MRWRWARRMGQCGAGVAGGYGITVQWADAGQRCNGPRQGYRAKSCCGGRCHSGTVGPYRTAGQCNPVRCSIAQRSTDPNEDDWRGVQRHAESLGCCVNQPLDNAELTIMTKVLSKSTSRQMGVLWVL